MFGEANAETARSAFELCEAGQFDRRIYGYFIPEADRYPNVLNSVEFRNQAKEVVARLENVSTNKTAVEIPLVTSPQSMLDFLKKRRELLLDYSAAKAGGAQTDLTVDPTPGCNARPGLRQIMQVPGGGSIRVPSNPPVQRARSTKCKTY